MKQDAEAQARTEALFEQIAAKPKWYRVLRDFLRRMMARLRGDKMTYQLLNTERMLTKAYQDVKAGDKGTQEAVKTGEEKTEPIEIRFSVMNNRSFEENVAEISHMSDEEAKRNKAEDKYIRVMKRTPQV
ncbi:MAG: hypothetical protein J6X30_04440, partial [Clostridia bacterium]|nr:hypothetical protein [Clostridia bacterium]